MIKNIMRRLKKYKLWIIIILLLNLIFGFLLWLIDDQGFKHLFPIMVLSSLSLYCTMTFIIYRNDVKREEAIQGFLEEPTIMNEKEIIGLFQEDEGQIIKKIGSILRENQDTINKQRQGVEEYEEYIESWAHEIKTLLGLMTFLLDNRREEISPAIYKRLEYARLKAARSDYFFKELQLKSLCTEVVEEYEILLQEQGVKVDLDLEDFHILSDKKGVQFIIRQIISNAIKYKNSRRQEPYISIFSQVDEKNIRLIIRDNGIGVKAYDLPLIFEKGFTGEVGKQRKNSTGMGLYIAQQVAEHLKVSLEASMEYIEGFEISLVFPRVVN